MDKHNPPRVALLGATRGLGWALARHLSGLSGAQGSQSSQVDPVASLLVVGRKAPPADLPKAAFVSLDLASVQQVEEVLFPSLAQFNPHKIFYIAGGGPFGTFEKKQWKDHLWAYQLNLLTPARLLHWAFQAQGKTELRQVVFVGSAIAEDQGEREGASYASAKHGLKGLVRSLQREDLDVRLFSPGYMDTQMLPPNAWPRQQGLSILSPEDVALELWTWSQGLAKLTTFSGPKP